MYANLEPQPRRRSPLNTVVTEMIRVVAADDDDRISQIGVAAAIDELIELDESRPESWYLEGLACGFGIRDHERAPADVSLERRRIAGILDAAVEQRDHECLARVGIRHEPRVRELIESGGAGAATAPMLLALLHRHPEQSVTLAAAAPDAFPGWEMFVTRAEERGRSLRDAWEPDRAAVVITGLAGVIARWRAEGADDPLLAETAARLTLARASIHREAGDLETAVQLLGELDDLDDSGDGDGAPIPGLSIERALTSLGIARPDDIRVSRALQGEGDDLAGVTPETRAVVVAAAEADPRDPVANLLAGTLALADGESAEALARLEVALAGLDHRVRPSFREVVDDCVSRLRGSPSLLEE